MKTVAAPFTTNQLAKIITNRTQKAESIILAHALLLLLLHFGGTSRLHRLFQFSSSHCASYFTLLYFTKSKLAPHRRRDNGKNTMHEKWQQQKYSTLPPERVLVPPEMRQAGRRIQRKGEGEDATGETEAMLRFALHGKGRRSYSKARAPKNFKRDQETPARTLSR